MTDFACDWERHHPWDSREPHVTIREATDAERELGGVPNFPYNGAQQQARRYVLVPPEDPFGGRYLGAFGLVDGGDTREEAVFWAERWASKQGGHFIRPEGWEDVEGHLPDDDVPRGTDA